MEKINLNEYLASNEYPAAALLWQWLRMAARCSLATLSWAAARTAATACLTPCPSAAASAPSQRTPQSWRTPASLFTIPVLTLRQDPYRDQRCTDRYHYDLMSQGKSFADALRTRSRFVAGRPQLHPPHLRCGVRRRQLSDEHSQVCGRQCGDSVQRYFFDYPQPVAGEGHFISTYKHNGNPIPSFEG